jgi:hypothetical protein
MRRNAVEHVTTSLQRNGIVVQPAGGAPAGRGSEPMHRVGFRVAGVIPMLVALVLSSPSGGAPAVAAALPTRIGQCSRTAISRIGQRLEDASTGRPIPGSGSAVWFANGGYQVSYEEIPQIMRSHPGDPVRICLVALPHDCPPGDTRGRIYKTTNLRTRRSWTLPDSEHGCGGA